MQLVDALVNNTLRSRRFSDYFFATLLLAFWSETDRLKTEELRRVEFGQQLEAEAPIEITSEERIYK